MDFFSLPARSRSLWIISNRFLECPDAFIKGVRGDNLQAEPPQLLSVPVAYGNTLQGFLRGVGSLPAPLFLLFSLPPFALQRSLTSD